VLFLNTFSFSSLLGFVFAHPASHIAFFILGFHTGSLDFAESAVAEHAHRVSRKKILKKGGC